MENKEFVPFGNNIRVVPDVKDQIIKTDTFCEHGKVVAVGSGVNKWWQFWKSKVKFGDEVSFWLFGIKEVDHDGEKHYILPVDDRFILEIRRNG